MPHKGTRSSAKAPDKKAARAPKPKAKPRGQAPALAEATAAASAAIQSPGASNASSSTHSWQISNDLDGQQERYHAAQLRSSNLPSAQASVIVQSTQTAGGKAYPRGYYPPDEGTGVANLLKKLQDPRVLAGGYTSRDAFERALVMNEPPFRENIEAARCVLFAPHRIPLKEFTSLRKKPETKGGLHPVWGYPWVQPEATTGFPQAESVFWA
ncbi:unnamed protein product [Phytophthora fragariaefolia]|uniref:Unnamed protein product n=1 Tax=Phytophthora fragariaefolia TaxID=1490495 RepID=A0A9W6XZU7_9STRA|nr:unnamed protein product [Phytophthora fragariaefolia]